MPSLELAITACAMALGVSGAQLPAPIGPASEGKLQCYAPNRVTKSCQSLAAYQSGPGGSISNPATVLISAAPPITMSIVTPVTIKAERVCGFVRPEDIAAAEFAVGGMPATASQTALLRQRMAAAQKAFFGHFQDGGEAVMTLVTSRQAGASKTKLRPSPRNWGAFCRHQSAAAGLTAASRSTASRDPTA